MLERESAPRAPVFQYSGHSDDGQEYSDQEPRELDEEEGDVVVEEEESSIDGVPLNMKTVWETGKLEKSFHPQTGKKVWKCHFCNGMCLNGITPKQWDMLLAEVETSLPVK